MHMGKHSTLVISPAAEVTKIKMMQLIKDPEPIVQTGVLPVGLDDSILHLVGCWIKVRFIR